MGSVLGSMSRKDRGSAPVLPRLQSLPDTTGFFQNIAAGFRQAVAGPHSTQNAKAIYESRYYDQIVEALNAAGEHATDYVESPVLRSSPFYHPVEGEQVRPDGRVFVPVNRPFRNPYTSGPSLTKTVNPFQGIYWGGDPDEMKGIWGAVSRRRQQDPNFLKGFADPQSIDALALKQRQADLAAAQRVTSRASTAGTVGAFIGGAAGSVASADPEALIGGFSGAGAAGKSVARQVIRHAVSGAATNVVAGSLALPGQAADAERLGQPMSAGDMLHSVADNALAGAVLGSGHVAIPETAKLAAKGARTVAGKVAENLPAPIRDPIVAASIRAGTVKDRSLLYEFQRAHSPYSVADTSTPEERAAAHTIVRDVETQEVSPLQPANTAQHEQNLSAVASALGVDLTPPDTPTTAPIQTPTVPDRSQAATAPRRPAAYSDAVHQAEGTGKNPDSSADGHFQFTSGTWLEYAPKVTDTTGMTQAQILALRHDLPTATKAEQLFRADNGRYLRAHGEEDSPGNLSLAHFLGKGDALKVLHADPATPIERIIDPRSFAANKRVLAGKSADEVIAWAHKRIGAAVDQPPARADAVPDDDFDYESPVPYIAENLTPEQLTIDADRMQYKSGGDENGVTDALKGVQAWNPLLSQQILTWEPLEGGRIVVDGHQRVGLAKRLSAEGQEIQLPALVIREADGITAAQARTLGALRNIANGTGTLLDNARVLRDAPDSASMLPRNAPLARDSLGLASLSHEAFGAAVNEVVPPQIAAQVGLNAPHNPEAHMPILGLLAKERISNPAEAGAITRQALADGFGTADEQQLSLLGNEPQQSLYVPIARIAAAAAKKLREEKRTFKVLGDKAGKIEAAGNVLDRTANQDKVVSNDEALAILDRTAHSAGPVRDALIAAARAELSGARRGDAVNQFLDALSGIDLRAAAAGLGSDGDVREPLGGEGRGFAFEAPDADLPGRGEPSLFDRAVASRDNAERFSDPVGDGAKRQADLLLHDLRQAARLEAAKPAPQTDIAGATYFYDGGSRQRLHSLDDEEPAWVPRDGDVALGQFEHGLKPGDSAVEVRRVHFKGNDLTWIGIVRPSVDARFGNRSNVARVGVWLKNAQLDNPLPALEALDHLSQWAADPVNAGDIAQSASLHEGVARALSEHVVGEAKSGVSNPNRSHPLLPTRAEMKVRDLPSIAEQLAHSDSDLAVFHIDSAKAISPSDLARSQGEPTPAELHALAVENQPQLAQAGDLIARETGATLKDPGVKGLERIQQKVELEGYDHAGQIKDASRLAFIVKTPEQAAVVAERVLRQFPEHADKGVQTLPQNGYTDHKIIVRFANGGVGEIQIIPDVIYREKYEGGAGKLYTSARANADMAERDRLNEAQRKAYAAALETSPFRSWSTKEKSASGNNDRALRSDNGTPSVDDLPTSPLDSRQPEGFQANARPDFGSDQSTATSRSSTSNNSTLMGETSGQTLPDNSEIVNLFDLPEAGFRVSEEGNEQSIDEILNRADADDAAAKALKDCL